MNGPPTSAGQWRFAWSALSGDVVALRARRSSSAKQTGAGAERLRAESRSCSTPSPAYARAGATSLPSPGIAAGAHSAMPGCAFVAVASSAASTTASRPSGIKSCSALRFQQQCRSSDGRRPTARPSGLRIRTLVRRWNAVDSDAYRVGNRGVRPRVTVAAGVTAASRWRLYAQHVERERICVGIFARPLHRLASASRRETCGPAPARGRMVPGRFVVTPHGGFAYGAAWDSVTEVEVRLASGASVRSATNTSQHGLPGRNRFWVVMLPTASRPLTVEGLDRAGQSLGRAEIRCGRECGRAADS